MKSPGMPAVSLAGFATACPPELMPRPGGILAAALVLEAQVQAHSATFGEFRHLIAQFEGKPISLKLDRTKAARMIWEMWGLGRR